MEIKLSKFYHTKVALLFPKANSLLRKGSSLATKELLPATKEYSLATKELLPATKELLLAMKELLPAMPAKLFQRI